MPNPLVLTILALAGFTEGATREALDVLDRWQAGVDLITSYDLTIELRDQGFVIRENNKERIFRNDETIATDTYRSRIRRQGRQWRGEFGDEYKTPNSGTLMILNGDCRIFNWSKTDQHRVSIDKRVFTFGSIEYQDYEATFRTVMGMIDRISLSKARRSTLAPREGRFYVIETPVAEDGDWMTAKWKIWLDPNANFMPVKIRQWFVKSRTMLDREIENELAEVAPGVWAPIRSMIRLYSKDENSAVFGKCIGIDEITVVRNQSQFNIALSDDLFVQEIPVGSQVVDSIRNITYTEGATNPEAYLAHLAKSGEKAVELVTSRGERIIEIPDPPKSRWHWLVYALPTVALLLVVITLSTYYRKRPRTLKANS